MQRKIPNVTDAQVGFFALQSKQILFSGLVFNLLKTAFLSVKLSDAIEAGENGREKQRKRDGNSKLNWNSLWRKKIRGLRRGRREEER